MRSVMRILTHIVCGLVLGSLWSVANAAAGQPAGRRVATLQALAAHPIFFHGKEVLVRAEAESEQVLTYLVDDQHRLLALDVAPPIEGTRDRLEILEHILPMWASASRPGHLEHMRLVLLTCCTIAP